MTLSGVALHVEVAFSAGPWDTSPTWTDVTAFVRHVTTKRGRNNEFDRIEAGTCSVTFDNADGRFTPIRAASPSPYQGNILPRKQIRVRAVVGGVSKPMFTGYTERWSLTHPGGGDYAEAVCECADAFKILSTRKVLDFYGENIQRLNPAAYYPLNEPAGTVLFGDHSGHGLPAGVLGHRTGNDQSAAGGPELVPPSTSVSFDPDGAAGGADIDLTGALPAFPFHTDDWSASFWFQLGANYYPGGRTNPPIPGPGPTPPTPDVPPAPVGPGAGPGGSGGDPGTPPTVTPGTGAGANTGTIGWDPSGAPPIDAWRITPDTGIPFDVTPAQIASTGFPTIPLTPGACNSVTIQAHNASGWSAPSLPSACTTNQGVQGVYDSFVRADATGGFGTASNGTGWSAHYAGGIKENAGYSPDSLGWEMLDIGSRDQDWLMDVHGSDVADPNGVVWLYFSGKTGSYDYLRLTCSPTGYSQQSSLDVGTAAVAWFPNYTLDQYDQYHVQSYDVGSGKFRVCVSRAGAILLNELVGAPGDATWTYAGVGLNGGPYPWGNNHQRAAAFMQSNPNRVRGPRATPGVGQASFTCDPPAGVAHPTQYRVKVDGRTVTAATLPIVVDGLTDFTEYTFTMSAKAPNGAWGFDSDRGRVTPGWAAAPTVNSATRTGYGEITIDYTLGAANSTSYSSAQLHLVNQAGTVLDFSPSYPSPIVLTGDWSTTRVKLWVSGSWNDNPCNTVSALGTVP